jgi:hypothetical protein
MTWNQTIPSTRPANLFQSERGRNSRRLLNQSDNSSSFEITESKFSVTFGGGLVFFKDYPTLESINDLRRMMDILTDSLIEEKL